MTTNTLTGKIGNTLKDSWEKTIDQYFSRDVEGTITRVSKGLIPAMHRVNSNGKNQPVVLYEVSTTNDKIWYAAMVIDDWNRDAYQDGYLPSEGDTVRFSLAPTNMPPFRFPHFGLDGEGLLDSSHHVLADRYREITAYSVLKLS